MKSKNPIQSHRLEFWLEHISATYPSSMDTASVGCVEYNLPPSEAHVEHSAKRVVHLMDNWVTVHNALNMNPTDDLFGDRAKGFKAASDLFFDRKTLFVTTVTTLYISALRIPMLKIDPTNSIINISVLLFNVLALVMLFWSSYIYRGNFFPPSVKEVAVSGAGRGAARTEVVKVKQRSILRMTILLVNALYDTSIVGGEEGSSEDSSVTFASPDNQKVSRNKSRISVNVEMASTNPMGSAGSSSTEPHTENPLNKAAARDRLSRSCPLFVSSPITREFLDSKQVPVFPSSFNQTLNIATKYIVFTSPDNYFADSHSKLFNFKSRAHEFLRVGLALICVVNILVVIYGVFWIFLGISLVGGQSYSSCSELDLCQAYWFFFVFSGFNIVSCIQCILLYGSITVIYSGILLSGDMAHELCKAWQIRYCGLRRVHVGDKDSQPSGDGNGAVGANSESSECTELLAEEREREDGADNVVLDGNSDMSEVLTHLRRDAFERYLFIRHFLQSASKTWGVMLALVFILCIGATVFTYVELVKPVVNYNEGTAIRSFPLICALIVEVLLVAFPLNCLAYANIRVDNIRYFFSGCAPGDFGALGDISEWNDFLNANPLYWSVLGVPITVGILQSYVSTFVGIIPVLVVSLTTYLK